MGEYVKFRNDSVKIGTCENLYYTSRNKFIANLPKMKREQGNDEPMNYAITSGYRWRFPFPDEDELPFGSISGEFNRGILLMIPEKYFPDVVTDYHETITIFLNDNSGDRSGQRSGGHQINAFLPCVYDPKFEDIKNSSERSANKPGFFPNYRGDWYGIVKLTQQKYVDGKMFPVLSCPYCGTSWRIEDRKEITSLVKAIRSHYRRDDNYSYYREICLRIIRGVKNNKPQQ